MKYLFEHNNLKSAMHKMLCLDQVPKTMESKYLEEIEKNCWNGTKELSNYYHNNTQCVISVRSLPTYLL